MINGMSKFTKSSLSLLLSLTSIIKASSQAIPCPVENLLGSTIEVVAFESCWKIEFFEGGSVYQDTSNGTDCSNPEFTTSSSTFNPSKSANNLAIFDISPAVGYDGELTLFEDTTLPTNDIQARMTEKLPRSPIFGTYGLTVTFQTCPTPSPSSVPSAPPSSTPSSSPSDEPSLHPSNAPSSEPSSAPSDEPSSTPSVSPTSTCPISEFTGRSFLLPLLNVCFKMEIFDGGSIYVDESDSDCLNPKFETSNPISYYGGTKDGNKATFIKNGNPGKWSGELFVVQGDQDSIKVSDLDIGQKQFQVLQIMKNCVAAPSMSPSVLPTDLPSYSSIPSMFPTRNPSKSPSTQPSSSPSSKPSNIHSSLPSLHPTTLHPNACPSDGFLGRTFKSVVFEKCWIFEAFTGGQIKVDPTDSTCSETTPHSSTYALSEYKQNTSNKILFEAIPGTTEPTWGGYIEILEDTKLTEESLELKKLGWNINEVVFTLTVPLCPSSAPSEKPSMKPSIYASSEPSTQPIVNKPAYTPFKANWELKNAVHSYCHNPEGWKRDARFITHGPIEDWNTSEMTDMSRVFLDIGATCNPNLAKWDVSKVTTFEEMFRSARDFNGDISKWDTSSATNFSAMFLGADSFNGDISKWDTSKVTNFEAMFFDIKFNRDISKWDTSSATNFSWMFHGAISFNRDLSAWDVSKVTNFYQMFNNARAFNRDLSAWDTSSANNLKGMFRFASSFNQDISGWNTSSVTTFRAMFDQASAFDQNLCKWNVMKSASVINFCNDASCGDCSWY